MGILGQIDAELLVTLDEMITYFMCCWSNSNADSKARKMFDRYIETLKAAHRIVAERTTDSETGTP